MKLSSADIQKLHAALAVSRVIGTDLAVLHDSKIMGVNDKRDAAIISALKLGCPPGLKVGIGRVDELAKRLALLGADAEAELKINDRNFEVSQITLTAGRTKVQFRCTSMSLLERKYPQENADTPMAAITVDRAEITQLSQAVRTFGAEDISVKVESTGGVRVECADSNNDRFELLLERPAEFLGTPELMIFLYRADLLATLLSAASKDLEEVSFIIGEGGSLTCLLRDHTLILMPKATGD